MSSVTVFDIKRFAVHDGPGIRTTVFLKGCPMDCWWCHNPESRSSKPEVITYLQKLGEKEVESKKVYGKSMPIQEVIDEVLKDKIFFEESGGGVTFSGGEPLQQVDGLVKLLQLCKTHGLHTAVDTCGYAQWFGFEKITPYTDLFLYDLKVLDSTKHVRFTGVKNELIISNFQKLVEKQANIEIRIPVIPGVNDAEDDVKKYINFLQSTSTESFKIHLLPYHNIAGNKYLKLHLKNRMEQLTDVPVLEIENIKNQLQDAGFMVGIGG